jgi:hypothetical protein
MHTMLPIRIHQILRRPSAHQGMQTITSPLGKTNTSNRAIGLTTALVKRAISEKSPCRKGILNLGLELFQSFTKKQPLNSLWVSQ